MAEPGNGDILYYDEDGDPVIFWPGALLKGKGGGKGENPPEVPPEDPPDPLGDDDDDDDAANDDDDARLAVSTREVRRERPPCERCGQPGTTLWLGTFCSTYCEEMTHPRQNGNEPLVYDESYNTNPQDPDIFLEENVVLGTAMVAQEVEVTVQGISAEEQARRAVFVSGGEPRGSLGRVRRCVLCGRARAPFAGAGLERSGRWLCGDKDCLELPEMATAPSSPGGRDAHEELQ